MKERFYYCKECDGILGMIHGSHLKEACGSHLFPLEPKTRESGAEKHLPKAQLRGDRVVVEIGEISHPMEQEHHIAWVYLRTDRGGQRKNLLPDHPPRVEFALLEERPQAVYAYCNQHGLWKSEL